MGTTMRAATADDITEGATLHLVLTDGRRRPVTVEAVTWAAPTGHSAYGELERGVKVSDDTGSGVLWGSTVANMLAFGLIEVEEQEEPEPEPQAKPFRVAFWVADERAGWGDELVQAVEYLDTREEALWWELDRLDDWRAAPTSARAGVTVGYLQPDGRYKEIGRSVRTAPTMRHAFETATDRLGRAIL